MHQTETKSESRNMNKEGYGETLSHFYNCPVPLQIVPSKVMYIYDNHLLEGLGEDKW